MNIEMQLQNCPRFLSQEFRSQQKQIELTRLVSSRFTYGVCTIQVIQAFFQTSRYQYIVNATVSGVLEDLSLKFQKARTKIQEVLSLPCWLSQFSIGHVYLRPYVYSFCQIFQALRLFPALRLFRKQGFLPFRKSNQKNNHQTLI